VSAHPPEWQGILDEDEVILWQGRPEHRVKFEFRSAFEPLFFTFFTGFSIFWMAMASLAGGFFWMFGLIFFVVGSYNLIGQHFWKAHLRRATFYTITDRRAFIATNPAFGKRTLDSYPITPDTNLRIQDEKGLTSIFFSRETVQTGRSAQMQEIGFELLADGRDVYSKMRQLQKQQVAAT